MNQVFQNPKCQSTNNPIKSHGDSHPLDVVVSTVKSRSSSTIVVTVTDPPPYDRLTTDEFSIQFFNSKVVWLDRSIQSIYMCKQCVGFWNRIERRRDERALPLSERPERDARPPLGSVSRAHPRPIDRSIVDSAIDRFLRWSDGRNERTEPNRSNHGGRRWGTREAANAPETDVHAQTTGGGGDVCADDERTRWGERW